MYVIYIENDLVRASESPLGDIVLHGPPVKWRCASLRFTHSACQVIQIHQNYLCALPTRDWGWLATLDRRSIGTYHSLYPSSEGKIIDPALSRAQILQYHLVLRNHMPLRMRRIWRLVSSSCQSTSRIALRALCRTSSIGIPCFTAKYMAVWQYLALVHSCWSCVQCSQLLLTTN